MITLDTSGLLALTNRRDPDHLRSRTSLVSDSGPFLVPAGILAEVAYMLEQRPTSDEVEAAAHSIWRRSAAYLASRPFGIEADRAALVNPVRVTSVSSAFVTAAISRHW